MSQSIGGSYLSGYWSKKKKLAIGTYSSKPQSSYNHRNRNYNYTRHFHFAKRNSKIIKRTWPTFRNRFYQCVQLKMFICLECSRIFFSQIFENKISTCPAMYLSWKLRAHVKCFLCVSFLSTQEQNAHVYTHWRIYIGIFGHNHPV